MLLSSVVNYVNIESLILRIIIEAHHYKVCTLGVEKTWISQINENMDIQCSYLRNFSMFSIPINRFSRIKCREVSKVWMSKFTSNLSKCQSSQSEKSGCWSLFLPKYDTYHELKLILYVKTRILLKSNTLLHV